MGKNKKKAKKAAPKWMGELQNQQPTPEKRAEAVTRLKDLFTGLTAAPETVEEMLDRLGIPFVIGEPKLWDGDPIGTEYVVFRKADMEKGEQNNESLLQRIYKGSDIPRPLVKPPNT